MISNSSASFLAASSARRNTASTCQTELLDYSPEELTAALEEGTPLVRLEGLRCLYFARSFEQGVFYINGDEYQLPSQDCKLIPLLADEERLAAEQLNHFLESTESLVTTDPPGQPGLLVFRSITMLYLLR